MRQAIHKMLGLKTAATKDSGDARVSKTVGGDSRTPDVSIEDNSDNGIRRQLVQVVLRDCLRRNGIPARWIECQMMVAESRSRGPGLYVRLVLRHWDERLLRYAFAFETQLRAAITQFEPQASTWLHGMSWELDLRTNCPYPDMPDPASWVPSVPLIPEVPELPEDSPEPVGTKVDTEDEVLQDLKDLQRMFAARDVPLDLAADSVRVDFQNTAPPETK
ncbi:MAG: hypothetical protein Q8M51_03205 [Polaromonas sp.]|uniref:hypothetical protein n=1 Tax=Polaromonas sp. TaxID=1869339 RepID=UPI00272F2BC7|nr:hypothetical protein [Polaromonas sp.]MDP1742620.1 hypothetical protein [Polaromonas sp.]MDP1955612.1 hypothetical protein [Polaromonas sp.]MDP3354860.1 hypothetical protein [Polaromonas sp.]MDP3752496.1 hypothetical protein [Polaromonas sp.]